MELQSFFFFIIEYLYLGNQIYQNINLQLHKFSVVTNYNCIYFIFNQMHYLLYRKGVPMIYCYRTNHPQRLWLKTSTIIVLSLRVFEESVIWELLGWVALMRVSHVVEGQMVSGAGVGGAEAAGGFPGISPSPR